MLPTLGALYERIDTNRLNLWIDVNEEQSAFQKKKSTVCQLFILRVLIEIAKKTGTPLYIGFFDFEKASDKVSRLLRLSKLVKLDIGSLMLKALKTLYVLTFCVLSSGDEISTDFPTYTQLTSRNIILCLSVYCLY